MDRFGPQYIQYLVMECEKIREKHRPTAVRADRKANWRKIKGTSVLIDKNGNIKSGPPALREWANNREIVKNHNPDDYSNLKVGFAGNTERHEVGGFEEKGKEREHIKSHMESMGYKPNQERQYKADAVEFMSQPLSETMEELEVVGKVGRKIYRYDYKTNRFGVINSRDNVSTYFAPDDKAKYWEEKIEHDGQRKKK